MARTQGAVSVMNVGGRLNPVVTGAAIGVIALALAVTAAITGALPRFLSQQSAGPALSKVRAHEAPAECWRCGTVETIRAVEVRSESSGPAAVIGPALGHVVGDHHVYRVTVRMEDGSFRTVSLSSKPPLAVGDKVRIEQGALIAAGS